DQAQLSIVNSQLSMVNCGSPVTDIRDGKTYPTVQIGTQCWMAANLDYGMPIASSQHQRDNCTPEKYCYNDLPANCQLGTACYQWDELMRYDDTPGLQGLCLPAWHVPTEADWNLLFSVYINSGFAGSPLKYSGYSGFNALLTGAKEFNKTWDYNGFAAFFWSSTKWGSDKAWAHGMNDPDPSVSRYPSYRENAISVRCIKD
ncbi:MAG TPA: FISUMP domain-containing protein, partial [Bacteroidales bacterium]|nr:FISUMP domain-containing protein [Bacteroidales bacterium]